MKILHVLAAACAAAAIPVAASASVVFDFESVALGSYPTFSQTVSGLTASFSSQTGNIEVQAPGAPGVSGHVVINYFSGGGLMTANFSSLVNGITIYGSDFQPSDVDHIYLAAYSGLNGTGSLLGSITSAGCCSSGDVPGSASLSVTGAQSIQFYTGAGDDYPGALYFDNLTIDSFGRGGAVPEPASWALLIAGFGAAGAMLRRRRLALA